MRTLFLATAAFAALVIVAPVGHADGLSDLNARVQVAAKAAYADCVKKGDTKIFGVNWNIRDDHPKRICASQKGRRLVRR